MRINRSSDGMFLIALAKDELATIITCINEAVDGDADEFHIRCGVPMDEAIAIVKELPLKERSWLYLLRLAAFLFIIVAIWRKNLTNDKLSDG